MSTTLTIRNLAEPIKQKLRIRAASHGRSMEAEAREILTSVVTSNEVRSPAIPQSDSETAVSVCGKVRGAWKDRMSTDEIMNLTRGE